MPLESDARAYEFLASYNNDVERAKFFLHSTLSFGKGNDSSLSPYHLKRLSWNIFTIFNFHLDFVHTKVTVGPPVSSAAQLEDRVQKLGMQYPMFGAYESSDKTSRSYTTTSSRSGDAYGRDMDITLQLKSPSSHGISRDRADGISETSLNDGEKRQRFDKQEIKKRWHMLFKQLGTAADLLLCTKKDRLHLRHVLGTF